MKPLILGINGSPKKNGYVGKMLAETMSKAKSRGARTRTINLADYKILHHTGILNENLFIEKTSDDMPKLQKLVLDADAIIFATPTHWFNTSSLMKVFIDRLTSLEHFNFLLEGKVAGFIVYGPQGGAVNAAMTMMMVTNQMGMVVPPYGTVFDEGRNDKWIKPGLKLLAKNILQMCEVDANTKWGYDEEKYKVSPRENI
jgi:multimeric flavodoxin WrbA